MAVVTAQPARATDAGSHARWVRLSHWSATLSLLTLAFSGSIILMAHPRLYWGDAGNDLTPALIELPISRNYKHGGYAKPMPFFDNAEGPVSASRTFDIFNQNGWGRSLHFLSAWFLVVPGAVYVLLGLSAGHFRAHIWPRLQELAPHLVWRDVLDHLRLRIPRATGGPQYGLLQKCAYTFVLFIAAPLMVATGVTMSPTVTAAIPLLLNLFGGYQSARTIHFFVFVALVLFVVVHIVMVVKSGLRRQLRAMLTGK
ncbi:MAG: cytochrome b/b6 domain-containing protein [Vicinamibacterales bacterium]